MADFSSTKKLTVRAQPRQSECVGLRLAQGGGHKRPVHAQGSDRRTDALAEPPYLSNRHDPRGDRGDSPKCLAAGPCTPPVIAASPAGGDLASAARGLTALFALSSFCFLSVKRDHLRVSAGLAACLACGLRIRYDGISASRWNGIEKPRSCRFCSCKLLFFERETRSLEGSVLLCSRLSTEVAPLTTGSFNRGELKALY